MYLKVFCISFINLLVALAVNSANASPSNEYQYLIESEKNYPVSFNGKTKFTINLSLELDVNEIEKIVLSNEKTISILNNLRPKKVIVVPGKIINIVV